MYYPLPTVGGCLWTWRTVFFAKVGQSECCAIRIIGLTPGGRCGRR
jgi:hypothetical protein